MDEHFDEITRAGREHHQRRPSCATSSSYLASKFVFLRFNYTTGDAAGQNMAGKATFAACAWISSQLPGVEHFFLESNFATDKKASQVNMHAHARQAGGRRGDHPARC